MEDGADPLEGAALVGSEDFWNGHPADALYLIAYRKQNIDTVRLNALERIAEVYLERAGRLA